MDSSTLNKRRPILDMPLRDILQEWSGTVQELYESFQEQEGNTPLDYINTVRNQCVNNGRVLLYVGVSLVLLAILLSRLGM